MSSDSIEEKSQKEEDEFISEKVPKKSKEVKTEPINFD